MKNNLYYRIVSYMLIICLFWISDNVYAISDIKYDCYKKSVKNINDDNINLGYRLDAQGRNYYYSYYLGVCQAASDYKNKIQMRDQESFYRANTDLSKYKISYSEHTFSNAWKGYVTEYVGLKILDPKRDQFNGTNETNNYSDLIINAVKPFVVIPENVDVKARATVKVELNSNLDIKSVKLIKSSGNSSYDRNIESAIWTVKKFPPLPNGANFVDYKTVKLSFQSSNLNIEYINQVINALKSLIVIPKDINVEANSAAAVKVELNSSLDINSVTLIESSGNLAYDKSVENAIWALKTFPSLPIGANFSDYKVMQLTFNFLSIMGKREIKIVVTTPSKD